VQRSAAARRRLCRRLVLGVLRRDAAFMGADAAARGVIEPTIPRPVPLNCRHGADADPIRTGVRAQSNRVSAGSACVLSPPSHCCWMDARARLQWFPSDLSVAHSAPVLICYSCWPSATYIFTTFFFEFINLFNLNLSTSAPPHGLLSLQLSHASAARSFQSARAADPEMTDRGSSS
jgi:hypothetical protein